METPVDDVEKQNQLSTSLTDDASSEASGDAQVRTIRESNAVLRFFGNIETRIDSFSKFEAMGVERIPEDKRRPPQKLNVSDPLPSHFSYPKNHLAKRK